MRCHRLQLICALICLEIIWCDDPPSLLGFTHLMTAAHSAGTQETSSILLQHLS